MQDRFINTPAAEVKKNALSLLIEHFYLYSVLLLSSGV